MCRRQKIFLSVWILLMTMELTACQAKKTPDCTRPRIVNKGTGGDLNYYVQMTCKLMDLDRDDFDKGEKHCEFFYNKADGPGPTTKWTKVESVYIIQSSNIVSANNTVQVPCLLSIWVSDLKNGSYKFKFAYPQNDDEYKSVESPNTITLRAPKVEIINCPTGESVRDGYIKVGTNATCGCRLMDKGNPVAKIQWIDSEARVKATDNNIAKLTLMASKDLHDTNYDCVGKSADSKDYEHRVQYRANIAYGPEKVYINTNKKTKPFTLCPKSQLEITIRCDVIKPYNPDVTVYVRGLEKDTIIERGGSDISGYRRFSFSVSPKMGGVYSVACVAVNSIFNDLSAEKSESITVEAPPPQPPVLTINNGAPLIKGQTVNVALNQPVTFNCKVKGGYPKVSLTTLKYGRGRIRKIKVVSGDEVTDSFDVTEEFDGKRVECSAFHKTGCYEHTMSVTLNVKGPFQLYANQTTSDFQGTAGQETTIEIFITGFQEPKEDEIKLYKGTYEGQHTIRQLTDDDTDDGRYTLSIQEVKEGHWNLTLTFPSLVESDSGQYQLEIDNGVEPNLIYKFDIKVDKSTLPSKTSSLPYILVGVVVVVVLIVIIVIMIVRKKCFKNSGSYNRTSHASLPDAAALNRVAREEPSERMAMVMNPVDVDSDSDGYETSVGLRRTQVDTGDVEADPNRTSSPGRHKIPEASLHCPESGHQNDQDYQNVDRMTSDVQSIYDRLGEEDYVTPDPTYEDVVQTAEESMEECEDAYIMPS